VSAAHSVSEPQSWQDSGDRSQPDPQFPGRYQETVVSLIRKFPGRYQETVVCLIRNPGTHGPGVPKTHEATVKCTD
ncbi:hypothetical protein Prudu_001589, partial [Prunus dulcis]